MVLTMFGVFNHFMMHYKINFNDCQFQSKLSAKFVYIMQVKRYAIPGVKTVKKVAISNLGHVKGCIMSNFCDVYPNWIYKS